MLTQNSIEARLRGGGLIATVVQADEVITDLGDFVIVKVYGAYTVHSHDLGVSEFPITLLGDCFVHLAFDFSHTISIAGFRAKVKGFPRIETIRYKAHIGPTCGG